LTEPRVYRSGGGEGDYLSRWKRIVWLDQQLRGGTAASAGKLARACGVSTKTIYRDLEAMRDQLGAPIRYDPRLRGYVYTDPDFAIPAATLSERDLFALMVAENALAQYEGTPLAGYLREAFAKILATLPGDVRAQHGLAARAIHFGGLPPVDVAPEVWSTLAAAILERARVELDYYLPSEGEAVVRTVDPHLLVVRDREWFLVARMARSGKEPIFYLPRVRAVRRTGERFERDPGFSAEAYYAHGFNAMQSGGEPRAVALRFPPERAHLADERAWSEDQRLTRHRDGSVTVRFHSSALFAVERQLLRYGGRIEALSPPELRRALARAGERLGQVHADRP
jgi:predicted DNA-binding transcriptional regulator YafY